MYVCIDYKLCSMQFFDIIGYLLREISITITYSQISNLISVVLVTLFFN
jgi:hypothetical protein